MLHSCNFDILLFLETSYACHITFFYSQFHMKFSILTLLCLSSYMLLITIAIVIIVLVFFTSHAITTFISTSNDMLGRAIWDQYPECIFENFEVGQTKFSKITRLIYPKYCLN